MARCVLNLPDVDTHTHRAHPILYSQKDCYSNRTLYNTCTLPFLYSFLVFHMGFLSHFCQKKHLRHKNACLTSLHYVEGHFTISVYSEFSK